MLATLLLELGLPEAPHSACLRWRREVPGCVARVFERHGLEFERVRPMGSLRRLAFWVEGIPTLTTPGQCWQAGPLERVARASDGTWTPVALEFAKRQGRAPEELEVRGRKDQRRLGVTVIRHSALAATVLPRVLPEVLDMLESVDRADSRRTMPFRQALAWLVVLLGDTRIRFQWHDIQADRYTYPGSEVNAEHRIAVPHFYEYHATLAQAGIRVDEATRREHLVRQLNGAATDLGGRCLVSESQLAALSFRLDRPRVHIHRGMSVGVSPAFVEAVAAASTYCVVVRRGDGDLAQGWVVVSEEDEELAEVSESTVSEAEHARAVFSKVLHDASTWLVARDVLARKRVSKQRVEAFLTTHAPPFAMGRTELSKVVAAAWWCESAANTEAFRQFPGTHLLLAAQRATKKKAPLGVRALIDEQVEFGKTIALQQGDAADEKQLSDGAAAVFVVLAFQHLVRGFTARNLPLIEHDPWALRALAERLFAVLMDKGWSLPIVQACETAAGLWGPSEDDVAPASVRDAGAEECALSWSQRTALTQSLVSFLRHRMRRYLEKSGQSRSDQVPSVGEWSPVLE